MFFLYSRNFTVYKAQIYIEMKVILETIVWH
jgi:hypothetical protein